MQIVGELLLGLELRQPLFSAQGFLRMHVRRVPRTQHQLLESLSNSPFLTV
jgi:hypothetical protein